MSGVFVAEAWEYRWLDVHDDEAALAINAREGWRVVPGITRPVLRVAPDGCTTTIHTELLTERPIRPPG